MKRCQRVKPVLVAQVKFTEWTLDDQLRQAVFLGLRTELRRPTQLVRSGETAACRGAGRDIATAPLN